MNTQHSTFLGEFRWLVTHNPFGLGLIETARQLKVDPSTLSRYLAGTVFPGWCNVMALAYLFHWSPEQVQRLSVLYDRDRQHKEQATTEHRAIVLREKTHQT